MSKTVCKCGAEYVDDVPFGDEQVDSCPRCSKYARAESTAPSPFIDQESRVIVVWGPKKPTRVLD